MNPSYIVKEQAFGPQYLYAEYNEMMWEQI